MEEQAQFYNVPNSDTVDTNTFADVEAENAASFLLRQALGGYDQGNLKAMLSMKYPDTRLYRDDISIVVVFLSNPGDESFAVLESSAETSVWDGLAYISSHYKCFLRYKLYFILKDYLLKVAIKAVILHYKP